MAYNNQLMHMSPKHSAHSMLTRRLLFVAKALFIILDVFVLVYRSARSIHIHFVTFINVVLLSPRRIC